ncbi:myosuppressin [Cimex lectularius]|uniref:Myosuppressin n=1 Tax=Cimex lectularius TaxID=79782 RepID=A0A8I6SK73_CIMLE|nr:myosuppressin [Cimex lectularius]XP_024084761.1 myosuppressin [Cimex lectularius]
MNTFWVTLFVAAVVVVGCFSAPGPDCTPSALLEQPPRVRNICAALYQVSNALQAYMDDQLNYQPMLAEGADDKVKKQDQMTDHIFLRFGRRR